MNQREIEFKYIVKFLPQKLPAGFAITQAYLTTTDNTTKRIRKQTTNTETKYFLTVKSPGLVQRDEHEQEISAAAFQQHWQQKKPGEIHKKRYVVPITVQQQALYAEFDEYGAHLQGLLTVEVEVPDIALHPYILPALQKTFGYAAHDIIDVTEDPQYKNSNLTTVNINDIKKF